MNLLMVAPNPAIVDAAQHALITTLEHHGIDVVPHTLRHARGSARRRVVKNVSSARAGEPMDRPVRRARSSTACG